MRQFDQNAQQVAFKKAKRKTPDHMGNLLILLAGCAMAIIIALICLVMVFSSKPLFQAAGALGVVFVCGAMYSFLTNASYWQTIETITGHDLNQDGYIGTPVQEFNYQASERTAWRAQLPAPEPVLREWATAALNGGSLAYASWQKQFSTRSNYSDGADRYREFRRALVSAEWATENDTHGIKLTDRGEQALEDWLHQHPDPIPLLEA